MCSKFEGGGTREKLEKRFGVITPEDYDPAPQSRPGDLILAIDASGPLLLRWGLPSAWDGKLLINARAETLASKSTFRPLLGRRCLIPALAWFEWRAEPGLRGKAQYRLRRRDQATMAFAGLHDGQRTVIITRAAAPAIAEIHGRMPAILPLANENDWRSARDFAAVTALLDAPTDDLTADAASPPPRQQSLF